MGLAAGLLLGFAIIAGSGGLGAMSAGVPPTPDLSQGGSIVATTASVTVTATSSQPPNLAVGNLSSATATTVAPKQVSTSFNGGVNGATTQGGTVPAYSSRVDSITNQPLLTDAVVFVPVLVALLLGAALYRASYRGSEEPGEEPS